MIEIGRGRCWITSIQATMMDPTITITEFSTAHNIREVESPPITVNFSMSAGGKSRECFHGNQTRVKWHTGSETYQSYHSTHLENKWRHRLLKGNYHTHHWTKMTCNLNKMVSTSSPHISYSMKRILSLTTLYFTPASFSTTMSMKQAMRPVRTPMSPQITQRLISRHLKPCGTTQQPNSTSMGEDACMLYHCNQLL